MWCPRGTIAAWRYDLPNGTYRVSLGSLNPKKTSGQIRADHGGRPNRHERGHAHRHAECGRGSRSCCPGRGWGADHPCDADGQGCQAALKLCHHYTRRHFVSLVPGVRKKCFPRRARLDAGAPDYIHNSLSPIQSPFIQPFLWRGTRTRFFVVSCDFSPAQLVVLPRLNQLTVQPFTTEKAFLSLRLVRGRA